MSHYINSLNKKLSKNLLVITNLFPTYLNPGIGSFNYQQIRELTKFYERIHVIVPIPFKKENFPFLERQKKQILENGKIAVYYPWYYYTPKILRGYYRYFYYFSIEGLANKLIRKYSINHIYSTWLYPDSIAALQIARENHIPLISKIHGSDINYLSLIPSIKKVYNAKLHEINSLVCVSNNLASRLSEYPKVRSRNVYVIYNGIDHSKFKMLERTEARKLLAINAEKKVICYVGNLKVSKGILKVLDLVEKLDNNCICYFVGDGPDKNKLLQQISQRKLTQRTEVVGAVPHDQIYLWLNAADYTVLLSENEGIPNVLLESFACGTPAITLPVGGIPEILKENVNGLWHSSLNNLNVNNIFTREFERGKIQDTVSHLSWEKNASHLLQVFERALY